MSASPIRHDTAIARRIGKYADAVEVVGPQRWLSTSGNPGFDADGNLPATFEAQAEWAWRNAVAALTAADMNVFDIVRVVQYLTRADDVKAHAAIRARFLGDARPASTLIIVAALPWPDMLIEVQFDAARAIGA